MLRTIIAACCLACVLQAQDYSSNGDQQLATYIQEAIGKNPGIRQAFAEYRSALQRLPQVSSLPDPVLMLTQYLRSPETRVGPQATMVLLSQQFPWFGKLSDREKVAAKQAATLRELYEAEKAETVRQLKLAYYSLAYVDRAIAITEEELTLLEHYETLAQARYRQGAGLQQAVVKLQAEITRDQNRLIQLESRRVDAEAVMNQLLDRPARSPIGRIAMDGRPRAAIDTDELSGIGRRKRPEVVAALLRIEKDEKRIQLARRDYWPDFTLGASFVNVWSRDDPAGIASPPGSERQEYLGGYGGSQYTDPEAQEGCRGPGSHRRHDRVEGRLPGCGQFRGSVHTRDWIPD